MKFLQFESDRPAQAPKRAGPVQEFAWRALGAIALVFGGVAILAVTLLALPQWAVAILASALVVLVIRR